MYMAFKAWPNTKLALLSNSEYNYNTEYNSKAEGEWSAKTPTTQIFGECFVLLP